MNPPENKMATLLGGVDLEVTKLDGSKETVKVLQLRLRDFQGYLSAIEDEPRLIEILTGKNAAWVDSLTLESQVALIESGEGINGAFFAQWLRRKLGRQTKLIDEIPKEMLQLGQSSSTNTLQSSPAKPA